MEESRVTEGEKIGKTHTPQPTKQLFSKGAFHFTTYFLLFNFLNFLHLLVTKDMYFYLLMNKDFIYLFIYLPGLTKGKWNASGTKTAIELIARRSQ